MLFKLPVSTYFLIIGFFVDTHLPLLQSLAECNHEMDLLKDQLSDVQEQNVKMEGLMNFLEEEKNRLQDKVEKMTKAGGLHTYSFILKMFKNRMKWTLDIIDIKL